MTDLGEYVLTLLKEYSESKRPERYRQGASQRAEADARSLAAFYERQDAEKEVCFRAFESEYKKQNARLETIKAALDEAEAELKEASADPVETVPPEEKDPLGYMLQRLAEKKGILI